MRARRPGMQSLALPVLLLLGSCAANDDTHLYEDGEVVTMWFNKVGPYNNPQETYQYFDLPFCKPLGFQKVKKREGLGEVLGGNELVDSKMKIQYKTNTASQSICQMVIDPSVEKQFVEAVRTSYWYQVFLDDLPQWGMVGEWIADDPAHRDGTGRALIYTHKNIDIGYDGRRIVQVNLTSESPKEVKQGTHFDLTYSVEWKEMRGVKWDQRFKRYLDYNFFEHQIHWFSICNSFMMVIFLTGLVALILMRTLRKDYAKYAAEDDDFNDMQGGSLDDSGWKNVHGDVFRVPAHVSVLSAVVGNGMQLTCLVVIGICLAMTENLYTGRGTALTMLIVCYALTSIVGGFFSGSLYSQHMEGRHGANWQRAMLLSAALFPGVVCCVAFLINFVAWYYATLHALSLGTMLIVALIWLFVAMPLTMLGTIIGRNWNGASNNPCRVNKIPSPIPDNPWFLRPMPIALLSGLLPFGSIFIEMYFIFTSFWNYKYYYVYGFMLLVFLILLVVSIMITIVSTYFLLNAEDYRWPWTALMSAASTAFYVYLYSVYYFMTKTKMTGFFQTVWYFGYMFMFCVALGSVTGSVGYMAASGFVRRIYHNIKSD